MQFWLPTEVQLFLFSTADERQYSYDSGNEITRQVFMAANYINYTYDNIGQLKTAKGYESGGTARLQEQFGYAYDKAWNLQSRTNNALIQSFGVNNRNELTSGSRGGTLTVAGSASEAGANLTGVTVNGQSASVYADGSFAKSGLAVANGNNTYTAVAQDGYGRAATDSVTVNLPASPVYTYDENGNLLSDGTRYFNYDAENQLTNVYVPGAWSEDFSYDGLMRRRIKREYVWSGSTWVQ